MDEVSRYAVGIDIGTSHVRTVVASVNREDNSLNVIGYAETPNSGMRRGMVVNLVGPSAAIDEALLEAERMSGYQVVSATVSINGSQIISTHTEGMIAVRAIEHEVNENDLDRVQEVALQGCVSPNQKILSVIPLQFLLDNQSIKNPLGMNGLRLEMRANVVSTLFPNYDNLCKVLEPLHVEPEQMVPSVMASARAVLTERQMENGVAVIDIGASTTGVAIYEENDLQYVGVVPVGSNNITNDLAVLLAIDTEVAEEIKRRFASGDFVSEDDGPVVIRWKGKELHFNRDQIDEAVQARLDEILDLVRKELKKAHYEQRLPEGVVLTGGGARMRDIDKFVRATLGMSVKIGAPSGLAGVSDAIQKPEYAAAVGLMLMSAENGGQAGQKKGKKKAKKSGAKKPSLVKRFFGKF